MLWAKVASPFEGVIKTSYTRIICNKSSLKSPAVGVSVDGVAVGQERRKVLLKPPVGGVLCHGPLLQRRPCQDLPSCVPYLWDAGEWSKCILANHKQSCGQGLRARGNRIYHTAETSPYFTYYGPGKPHTVLCLYVYQLRKAYGTSKLEQKE